MSEGAKRFLHIWAIGSGQFKAGWWVDTDTEVTSSGSEEKAETVGQTQFHQPRISSHTPLSLTPLQGWQYCLASAQSGGGLLCECISVHNQREGCLVNASVCTIRGRVAWWVHECAQSGGGVHNRGGGGGCAWWVPVCSVSRTGHWISLPSFTHTPPSFSLKFQKDSQQVVQTDFEPMLALNLLSFYLSLMSNWGVSTVLHLHKRTFLLFP